MAAAQRARRTRRPRGARAPDRGRALRPRADHRRARPARADGGRGRRPGAAQRRSSDGTSADRRAVLPRLRQDRQPRGARSSRSTSRRRARATSATRRCACSPTPARRRRSTRSSTSPASRAARRACSALDMLAQVAPGRSRAVGQLLSDSLFSGRRDEASYAASVLGRIGTEDARQALIAALDRQGQGPRRRRRGRARPDRPDRLRSRRALLSAARDNPHVKMQVMKQLVQRGRARGPAPRRGDADRQGHCGRAARPCGRSPTGHAGGAAR